MSYIDDEEVKIGEVEEEDLDDVDLDDPLDDDLALDEEDMPADFAGLDGSSEY
jgi:hypothetical protein